MRTNHASLTLRQSLPIIGAMPFSRFWRDHSLTVICWAGGILLIAIAWRFPEGQAFDTWLGLGHGLLTVGLFYTLANVARERAKPED